MEGMALRGGRGGKRMVREGVRKHWREPHSLFRFFSSRIRIVEEEGWKTLLLHEHGKRFKVLET